MPSDDQLPAIQPTSPAEMITEAIRKGVDAEGIKTLAEVYERMEAKRAEREFTAALLAFQADCPTIVKESNVAFLTKSGGSFNSKYAKLDQIVKTVRPFLQKHGFSFSFDTALEGKQVRSICLLSHIGGHTTRTLFTAPVDPAPKISEAHATASAISFAQRYAFQLALGIVTGLADDDGKAGFLDEPITLAQQEVLQKLIDETESNTPAFWAYIKLPSKELDQLPASRFALAQQALLQKKRTLKK